MRRYFLSIQYRGTHFAGWQMQNNALSVQECVEVALNKLLGEDDISVVGCGRTDAGVHASYFVAHFDVLHPIEDDSFLYKLNRVLSKDIHILTFGECSDDFHARFSAVRRTYKYLVDLDYSVFLQDQVFHYSYSRQTLDIGKMKEAAELLLAYEEFFPFCKSKSQTAHYKCQLCESRWELVSNRYLIYTVQANRFLRGMVRLIVGMCLGVGKGQIEIVEVQHALEVQKRLRKPFSAPACGLYLYDIEYPDGNISKSTSDSLFFPI